LGRRADGSHCCTQKLVREDTLRKKLAACTNLAERLKLLGHFLDSCQAMALRAQQASRASRPEARQRDDRNVTVDGHALSTPAFPYPGSSQSWAQQKIDKLSKEVGEPQAAPAPATSSPP